MSYRQGPCSFCDRDVTAQCPRCGVGVCTEHGLAERDHCAVCARELAEDLELRHFARVVGHSKDETGMFAGHGMSRAPLDALEDLSDKVGDWFDAHAAKKKFDARSHEEIAAWRRSAGVLVRGG
jgi:hypothetical protein